MSATHQFIPAWQADKALQTIRSQRYGEVQSKANRQSREDEDYDSDEPPTNSMTDATRATIEKRAGLSDESRKDPRYVAGLSDQDFVPASPYPHAAIKTRAPMRQTLQSELSALKPPLYEPSPDQEKVGHSLRRQHLGVLTTMMHTCLLKGDFVRAGRAWGMILRSDVDGRRPFDVRANARWGVGAEILLRRDSTGPGACPPSSDETGNGSEDAEHPTSSSADERPRFSEDGFRAAKAYYERLILQYPYRRQNANSINALDFYPAMFGLCVYEASEKRKHAMSELEARMAADGDELGGPSFRGDEDDWRSESRDSYMEQMAIMRHAELDAARQIAARLDELLISPPFDRYNPLVQLRGMVALWLSDLYLEWTFTPDMDTESMSRPHRPIVTQAESEFNSRRADDEVERAERCFTIIADSGADLPESVKHLVGTR